MRPSTAVAAIAAIASAILAGPVSAGPAPIACISQKALYAVLNAVNRHDRLAEARLEGTACQPLAGAQYEIVDERNGVTEIRLFPRVGDWADSRVAYTLDEMIAGTVR